MNILKELMNDIKEICLYPQFKKLWQYAVFRWCVYQIPLLVFGLVLKLGVFDSWNGTPYEYETESTNPWKIIPNGLVVPMWILIFTLPAIWVWRKPIWKLLKQAIGFLNKKAEE